MTKEEFLAKKKQLVDLLGIRFVVMLLLSKESYFREAVKNCKAMEFEKSQVSLFNMIKQ